MAQLYTLEEVKSHNGLNDAETWIVIHDVVYNATNFMKDHPGGGELIADVAGRDCTNEFDDFGHSSDAKNQLKDLKIGELVQEDRRSNQKNKITIEQDVIKRRRKFWLFFCA